MQNSPYTACSIIRDNTLKELTDISTINNKLSSLINNVHSMMIETANEACKYLKETNSNNYIKKKRWWNEEINLLFKKLTDAKKKYKETDYKNTFRKKKT